MFRVGIGPSSSHTVGPMRIAKHFLNELGPDRRCKIEHVFIELQGSLAFTGRGHGTLPATALGLAGLEPETFNPQEAKRVLSDVETQGRLLLFGEREVRFVIGNNIKLCRDVIPELHPNGMSLKALGADGDLIEQKQYFSVGGGFFKSEYQMSRSDEDAEPETTPQGRFEFRSAEELLGICRDTQLSIADVVLENERAHRNRAETLQGLDKVVEVMFDCIERGVSTTGVLPGGLQVRRRAADLYTKIRSQTFSNEPEELLDRLNLYALAVNEENAAGGQVVTAPTNGAAGILPAVLKHYCDDENTTADLRRRFLLTAGGVGLLYKQRASISGAEMGCQGEVGVACSMAAAGLTAVWGGTPQQCANAAEVGMEHNLGLTCDPVGGLVQIPCIERNAIGAVKAVNAARLALTSDEPGKVSLDQVIETMRQTGIDMSNKYKETSTGGLAVNVVEC